MIASDFTESITRADDVSFASLGEIVGEMNRCLNFWLIIGRFGDGIDGRLGFFSQCADLTVQLGEDLLFLFRIGYPKFSNCATGFTS